MRLAHTTHDYDGMHAQRTTKPFQSNPVQKHCYMIIDRSNMTETMLIVILSTNAPTMRIKIKAINNIKKTIIFFYFLFYLAGSNLCQDCFCALFFAFAWRSRPLSYLGLIIQRYTIHQNTKKPIVKGHYSRGLTILNQNSPNQRYLKGF